MTRLLAADVGGTKTLMGLFEARAGRPEPVEVRAFATAAYPDLSDIMREFLGRYSGAELPQVAVFGVAGPVVGGVAKLTNRSWVVDGAALSKQFSIARVGLLNDLQAMAYGVPVLRPAELEVLQKGVAMADGNSALIAAGTGLGEGMLHNVGGQFVPSPSEGGHADFAPRTPREIELLRYLTRVYGRATYEHVLSGPGLLNLFRFTHTAPCLASHASSPDRPSSSEITAAALNHQCSCCVEALDLFVAVYGAEAGNVALRAVATAGLFVGGGIAPKILPALRSGIFIDAFLAKAPMDAMMRRIPVAVVLNDEAALIGAAVFATRLASELDGGTGLV